MKRWYLLALCLPLACAQAASWKPLMKVDDGQASIDSASVSKNLKAWTKIVYNHPHESPGGKAYSMVVSLHQYACDERTAAILQQLYYLRDDPTVAPLEHIKFEKFNPEDIVPGTPNDAALKTVCAASPKKP